MSNPNEIPNGDEFDADAYMQRYYSHTHPDEQPAEGRDSPFDSLGAASSIATSGPDKVSANATEAESTPKTPDQLVTDMVRGMAGRPGLKSGVVALLEKFGKSDKTEEVLASDKPGEPDTGARTAEDGPGSSKQEEKPSPMSTKDALRVLKEPNKHSSEETKRAGEALARHHDEAHRVHQERTGAVKPSSAEKTKPGFNLGSSEVSSGVTEAVSLVSSVETTKPDQPTTKPAAEATQTEPSELILLSEISVGSVVDYTSATIEGAREWVVAEKRLNSRTGKMEYLVVGHDEHGGILARNLITEDDLGAPSREAPAQEAGSLDLEASLTSEIINEDASTKRTEPSDNEKLNKQDQAGIELSSSGQDELDEYTKGQRANALAGTLDKSGLDSLIDAKKQEILSRERKASKAQADLDDYTKRMDSLVKDEFIDSDERDRRVAAERARLLGDPTGSAQEQASGEYNQQGGSAWSTTEQKGRATIGRPAFRRGEIVTAPGASGENERWVIVKVLVDPDTGEVFYRLRSTSTDPKAPAETVVSGEQIDSIASPKPRVSEADPSSKSEEENSNEAALRIVKDVIEKLISEINVPPEIAELLKTIVSAVDNAQGAGDDGAGSSGLRKGPGPVVEQGPSIDNDNQKKSEFWKRWRKHLEDNNISKDDQEEAFRKFDEEYDDNPSLTKFNKLMENPAIKAEWEKYKEIQEVDGLEDEDSINTAKELFVDQIENLGSETQILQSIKDRAEDILKEVQPGLYEELSKAREEYAEVYAKQLGKDTSVLAENGFASAPRSLFRFRMKASWMIKSRDWIGKTFKTTGHQLRELEVKRTELEAKAKVEIAKWASMSSHGAMKVLEGQFDTTQHPDAEDGGFELTEYRENEIKLFYDIGNTIRTSKLTNEKRAAIEEGMRQGGKGKEALTALTAAVSGVGTSLTNHAMGGNGMEGHILAGGIAFLAGATAETIIDKVYGVKTDISEESVNAKASETISKLLEQYKETQAVVHDKYVDSEGKAKKIEPEPETLLVDMDSIQKNKKFRNDWKAFRKQSLKDTGSAYVSPEAKEEFEERWLENNEAIVDKLAKKAENTGPQIDTVLTEMRKHLTRQKEKNLGRAERRRVAFGAVGLGAYGLSEAVMHTIGGVNGIPDAGPGSDGSGSGTGESVSDNGYPTNNPNYPGLHNTLDPDAIKIGVDGSVLDLPNPADYTDKFPWDWAKDVFGKAEATSKLEELAELAKADGHKVFWGNLSDGNIFNNFLRIDGSDETVKVIEVLSQYIK